MGTNFYLHESACSECGHADAPRHIGKRSGGFVFLLHVAVVTDSDTPGTIEEWKKLFETDGLDVLDEYGTSYTTAAMLAIILCAKGNRRLTTSSWSLPEDGLPYDRLTGVFQ